MAGSLVTSDNRVFFPLVPYLILILPTAATCVPQNELPLNAEENLDKKSGDLMGTPLLYTLSPPVSGLMT